MTRIDFHSNVPDKIAYACRLTRKAYLAGKRVVLMTKDVTQLGQLDQARWTFSETDFLPHVLASDALAAQTPIVLSDRDSDELPHFDMLVNLSQRLPANFSRFERVFEIISSDPEDVAAGRKRYLAYKQQDYQPAHFVAGKT